MVVFQEEKGRMWSIADQPARQVPICNQTKEIQRDFTKFALKPKVHITQNKNLVKAIVNIYYIIVNSNQTFMPVSQEKIIKVDALLLTHAVYSFI